MNAALLYRQLVDAPWLEVRCIPEFSIGAPASGPARIGAFHLPGLETGAPARGKGNPPRSSAGGKMLSQRMPAWGYFIASGLTKNSIPTALGMARFTFSNVAEVCWSHQEWLW